MNPTRETKLSTERTPQINSNSILENSYKLENQKRHSPPNITEDEEKNKECIVKPFLYSNSRPTTQWTRWDMRNHTMDHELCNPGYDFDGKLEEDFYEGMRIQVNHLDNHLEVRFQFI